MSRHLPSRRHLTVAAGWLAAGFGAAHLVVAPWDDRRTLAGVWTEGWWDTVDLAEPTTPLESERSTVLWRTLGGLGAPMLARSCCGPRAGTGGSRPGSAGSCWHGGPVHDDDAALAELGRARRRCPDRRRGPGPRS